MDLIDMDLPSINPEHLAYWYFRLNGFMTTVNFVVHPEEGTEQRTDVDVLGVRFPYRAELLSHPMVDDAPFTGETNRPFVVIAEVKKDRCKLNGPWTKPDHRNMHRVLAAIGVIHPGEQDAAADALYTNGIFQGQQVLLSLCCVGAIESREVRREFKFIPQILWPQITAFIFRRFRTYFEQKLSHPQWDECGQTLWRLFIHSKSADHFGGLVCNSLSQGKTTARGPLQGQRL